MGTFLVETDQGTFEVDDGVVNPDLGSKIAKGVQDFGAGAMEGASFGAATINDKGNIVGTQEPEDIPGSIMRADGTAKPSVSQRMSGFKGAGRAIGSIVPMVASELMAGVPAAALALKYGMGPVRTAMNATGLTMATYGGLRGAAQNKPMMETAGNMATGYMTGMPLGAAGYGIGKGVDWLTTRGAEGLANQYLNTPPKIADSLMDKGKPSLGRQFLDKTKYGGMTPKADVYDDILLRREQNRMSIGNELQKADDVAAEAAAKLPEQPQPTFNKYKYPKQVQTKRHVTEVYEKDPLGVPVLTKTETDPLVAKTRRGGGMTGEYQQNPGTYRPDVLGTPSKVSDLPVGKGGGIDLREMRAAAGPVRSEQADIGAKNAVSSIDDIMGEYGVAPGETVVTNKRALEILTRLDSDVNKAYQALDPNTITPATEARAEMANWLRERLRQNVPSAASLLGENHSLNLFKTALRPQVSGRAPVSSGGDWMKSAAANTLGSRGGLGLARRLDAVATPGTLSNKGVEKGLKPTARVGGRLGLAEYLEDRNGRKRR